jgi:hypothetical protein
MFCFIIQGKLVCTEDGPIFRNTDDGAAELAEALEDVVGADCEIHEDDSVALNAALDQPFALVLRPHAVVRLRMEGVLGS